MKNTKSFTNEEFLEAIKTSKTLQEAATKLGYGRYSYNGKTQFRELLNKLQPDLSHFNLLSRTTSGFTTSKIEVMYNGYKRDSNRRGRNYEFKLSLEEFKELVESPCYYCANLGDKLASKITSKKYCGVDRKNNSKGYTVDNSVPCCKRCNRMKMELNDDDFLIKIKQIYENLKLERLK